MKPNSLTKNKILSFNYNLNQYSNSLNRKKETPMTKQSVDFSKKAPNTFRQTSSVNSSMIAKSSKASPQKNYKHNSNDKGKVLVQNYITPSTNAGSNPKLNTKEIREFNESSLNEMDFIKNKILKKKAKKVNYLNLSNPSVNKKNLGKSLDITARSSINNTKDNITHKKSISTYEAELSYRESLAERKAKGQSKDVSPRLDTFLKNYNLNKKSTDVKKNLYSSQKQNPEPVLKNMNNNFKKKNMLNIKDNIGKQFNLFSVKHNSTSANSRISSIEKTKVHTKTSNKSAAKNSNTSSMTNLLSNIKTGRESARLSKNTTNINLTPGEASIQSSALKLSTVQPSLTKVPSQEFQHKSNSIPNKVSSDISQPSKPANVTSKNFNPLLKSIYNMSNHKNNYLNVVNTYKRHISSTNSPKNRPIQSSEHSFIQQQKKAKLNTNNVSLNSSLRKDPTAITNTQNIHNNSSQRPPVSTSAPKANPKASFNLKLDLNKIQKKKSKDENSIENILNSSNCSIKSSLRESNYYKKEAEKLTKYIRDYYEKNKEYPNTNVKFYKYGRLLGRGAFGKVNLGLHILSGRLVAIKSFNKSNFTENSKRKIYYEFNLMKNLKHSDNIVKVYEIFETNKYIVIIMEYVCGGDLLSFIRKRNKLNEQTSKFIFRQIIEAIQYINSNNIIHRDIKLDNIMIDINDQIKICDFGVSRIVKRNEILHDQCGTPAYIAPEIIKSHGYEGFPVDIWSAGVVLYAMLKGNVPFTANNMEELHRLILRGNYSPINDISDDAASIISGLLELDPKKRLTPSQLLNHPFLVNSKAKLVLFTNAEIILLSKVNVDYRNAGKQDLNENFTLKNLDTQKESENNMKTKSNILAPFSSSVGQDNEGMSNELLIENDALRFVGKAIELNRNYELNNNGDIDNGVLINNSKKEEEKEIENKDQGLFSNNNSFNNKKYSKPTTPLELNENFRRKSSNLSSPRNESVRTSLGLSINEEIVSLVEELGYKREFLIKSLTLNEHNYATTTYFLLLRNSK